MSRTDNTLDSALWLAAGGAAGYAAARWVVAPWLAARSAVNAQLARPAASSASSQAAATIAPGTTTVPAAKPRALIAAPSLAMMPFDPYAGRTANAHVGGPYAGPSGTMRPIDPYAVPASRTLPHVPVGPRVTAVPIDPYATPSHPSVKPAITTGPITSPSQLDAAASATLGAELATVLTSSPPSSAPGRPVLPCTPEQARPITSPAPRLDLEVGPVTNRPSGRPVAIRPSRLPRRFDAIFDRHRGSIPIEYLRALVARESSYDPLARTGSAIGLMQIVPVVREDYNKRHGTPYQPEHLYDPTINVAVGCDLLRRIIAGYRRFHPRVPNLQENWENPEFALLLTQGWNGGYSEAGGVGRVARYLERLGTIDITIEHVAAHAQAAGATKHLFNPAKVTWCKSVVALYQRERALVRPAQAFASS